MKWFFILLTPFAALGVYFFYTNNMFAATPAIGTTTAVVTTGLGTTEVRTGSGIQGMVKIVCLAQATDTPCADGAMSVRVLRDSDVVTTFVTDELGNFAATLEPGSYELSVDTATSTRCASIGVVVPDNAYQTVNISCNSGVGL